MVNIYSTLPQTEVTNNRMAAVTSQMTPHQLSRCAVGTWLFSHHKVVWPEVEILKRHFRKTIILETKMALHDDRRARKWLKWVRCLLCKREYQSSNPQC